MPIRDKPLAKCTLMEACEADEGFLLLSGPELIVQAHRVDSSDNLLFHARTFPFRRPNRLTLV